MVHVALLGVPEQSCVTFPRFRLLFAVVTVKVEVDWSPINPVSSNSGLDVLLIVEVVFIRRIFGEIDHSAGMEMDRTTVGFGFALTTGLRPTRLRPLGHNHLPHGVGSFNSIRRHDDGWLVFDSDVCGSLISRKKMMMRRKMNEGVNQKRGCFEKVTPAESMME